MAQAAFVATDEQREQVEFLAAIGTKHEHIAQVIGCAYSTLREHFRAELDLGTTKANAAVAQSLFQTAMNPVDPMHVTACIFWLKTRAKWSELPEAKEPPERVKLSVVRPIRPEKTADGATE
jgi:hypothetical protein